MTVSIGIVCQQGGWQACVCEDGRVGELQRLRDVESALAYMRASAARHPQPPIVIAAGAGAGAALSGLAERQLWEIASSGRVPTYTEQLYDFLIATKATGLDAYIAPGMRLLPTLPAYRKLIHSDMGTPITLCALVALIYRMRQQEASWQEVRLVYLHVDQLTRALAVVEDGRIVNAIGEGAGAARYDAHPQVLEDELRELAFWEGLEHDLAGLVAIHHLDEVVVAGSHREALIARFEDSYRLYHFPRPPDEEVGFEAAIGAALLAGGRRADGLGAEVLERLRLE